MSIGYTPQTRITDAKTFESRGWQKRASAALRRGMAIGNVSDFYGEI